MMVDVDSRNQNEACSGIAGHLHNVRFNTDTQHCCKCTRVNSVVDLIRPVACRLMTYAVVTCEKNYFSLRRRSIETILFKHMKTCLKLFQKLM